MPLKNGICNAFEYFFKLPFCNTITVTPVYSLLEGSSFPLVRSYHARFTKIYEATQTVSLDKQLLYGHDATGLPH